MKLTRSVKCYFPWLTEEKKSLIKEFLSETNCIVNYCIEKHEKDILNGFPKEKLILKGNLQPVESWLTERAKKNCFQEAHGLIIGTQRSALELKKEYKTPTHSPNRIMLSCTNARIILGTNLKDFDLLLELYSFDSRKRNVKVAIPLKRHKIFNKWFTQGKLCSSIILTDKYIQFSFEMKVVKKTGGTIAGYDPGAKTLLTDDCSNKYGTEMWELLTKLKRKRRCSKAWYRCREEIKEYIDKTTKQLPWQEIQWLILENNKRIKFKSKIKRRTTARTRSFLAGWMRSRIDNRVEMLSQENGVYLRRVPAWYNSITCPMCGCCKKENRVSQAEFKCVECGHTTDADKVGALNSLARFSLGVYGSECKQRFIEKHPDYYQLRQAG